MPVATEEANVTTCTVEVKAVRIGKRQMTLSVFRQIPFAHDLIGRDPNRPLNSEPSGEVWGHVDYWWKGCWPGYSEFDGPNHDHRDATYNRPCHWLWADGPELRRTILPATSSDTMQLLKDGRNDKNEDWYSTLWYLFRDFNMFTEFDTVCGGIDHDNQLSDMFQKRNSEWTAAERRLRVTRMDDFWIFLRNYHRRITNWSNDPGQIFIAT